MNLLKEFLTTEDPVAFFGEPGLSGSHWWFFPGESPLCLVAHIDTVLPRAKSIARRPGGYWLTDGSGTLGADDRAGCYACFVLKKERPDLNVILCDLEESGMQGSRGFSWESLRYLDKFSHIRLLVGLDRSGHKEVVYYDWHYDNPPWVSWLFEDFLGFRRADGTGSDVGFISETLEVPHANVSVGFRNEHTPDEVLVERHLFDTLESLRRLVAFLDSLGNRSSWGNVSPEIIDLLRWFTNS